MPRIILPTICVMPTSTVSIAQPPKLDKSPRLPGKKLQADSQLKRHDLSEQPNLTRARALASRAGRKKRASFLPTFRIDTFTLATLFILVALPTCSSAFILRASNRRHSLTNYFRASRLEHVESATQSTRHLSNLLCGLVGVVAEVGDFGLHLAAVLYSNWLS